MTDDRSALEVLASIKVGDRIPAPWYTDNALRDEALRELCREVAALRSRVEELEQGGRR